VHQDGVAVADEGEHRLQPRRVVLRPEALSVNVRSEATPSNCRSVFSSRLLTRVADPLTADASPGKKCQAEP